MNHGITAHTLFEDDRVIAGWLAGLTILTRLPLATQMLYSWDSVNFAFAMQRFDVTRHAPHPPGYLYYVGLAKLLDLVFLDANRSLVAISVVFAALSVAAVYCFGRDLFGRVSGFVAGLLLITSVTFWSYGIIALPYMTLAFFSIATAWLAQRILFRRETRLLFPLTLLYSIGGGFRPDLLLFLAPLWLACLAISPWRSRLLNALVAALGLALWLTPVMLFSGGLAEYLAVLIAYFNRDVLERYSVTHVGGLALLVNLRDLASYIYYALYAQSLLLIVALGWWIRRRQWRNRVWWLIAAWVAPMGIFYLFVHIGDPGYVFAFTPALALLIGWFVDDLRRVLAAPNHARGRSAAWRRSAPLLAGLATAGVLILNVGIFLYADKPLTARGIRRNDHAMLSRLDFVRRHYAPRGVLLFSYSSYKHTRYYLADYPHSLWVDRFSRKPGAGRLPEGVRAVVVFDDDLGHILRRPSRWDTREVAPGVRLLHLTVRDEKHLIHSHTEIDVE